MLSVTAKLPDPPRTAPADDEAGVEGYPVIAITAHWRGAMRKKRLEKGMHQAQLGKLVGVSQNVINRIENGLVRRSKAVLPICNVLQIPPPMATFEDELDQKWHDLGRRLRLHDPKRFEQVLSGVEAQLETMLAQTERDRNH